MPPRVHILPLSKLVHASPTRWEKLLTDIEEGKTRAYKYYLPLREAVVLFCRKQGEDRERIIRQMIARARGTDAKRGDKIAGANEAAFRVFESAFYPRIQKFQRDFLRDDHPGCAFAGLNIFGHPHLEVIDEHGQERFVVLHASDWTSEELAAYLDLLSILIDRRFGKGPASIWCVSLRTGKDERVRSSSRLRARCENAARLYSRLITAMETEP